MDSLVFSLISGHLFSKGADAGQGRFQRYIQKKDLSRILDEYDDAFMHIYNTEISLNNCDMEAVFEKRVFLISCAKNHFVEDNSDITKNVEQKFIDTACKEIGDFSETVKTYLDTFYLLVFTKETKEVSVGFRALLNAYADSQHEINEKTNKQIKNQSEEIGKLKEEVKIIRDEKTSPVDFRPYYQNVEERFTEEKEEESIVGSESDERAYINAYIETKNGSTPALPFLEEWFDEKKSGAMLIHGEPGHGKTMLCRRAMVEFYRGKYLKGKAENVIAVSLNTGENSSIIGEGKVLISKALAWGAEQEYRFTFEDCRGALLFLDGFDEFIDDAKRTDASIDNICSFMKKVAAIAKNYDIHIVVLSRSVAVKNDLKNLTRICYHFQLSPISEMQQDEWLECHPEYSSYKETFKMIRGNSNMHVLLGVPLLFRLIVHNQFDGTSSNVVELYNNLFIHLMNKRNIFKDIDLLAVEKELMTLAYEVYCTDTNMAVLENVVEDPHWLFTFYVKSSGNGKIGFFHRTFYQYFFARFIYLGIVNLKEKEEKNFISLFAERELDGTIRKYLSFMIKEKDKSTAYSNIERLIVALFKTEAYLNFEPHVESGDAERSRILRSQNIYRNTIHIAAALSYVIQVAFKEKLDLLMRTYNSQSIVLVSTNDKRADLREADLRTAYLNGANLRGADLRGADLREANLSVADLIGVNLREADLRGADMPGAALRGAALSEADLRRAFLSRVDLREANLSGAFLREADLSRADLRGACLRGADLRGADLSGACLRKANLREADLRGADLREADLRRADLNGVHLRETVLYDAKIDVKYQDRIDIFADGYTFINWFSYEDDKQ